MIDDWIYLVYIFFWHEIALISPSVIAICVVYEQFINPFLYTLLCVFAICVLYEWLLQINLLHFSNMIKWLGVDLGLGLCSLC